MNNTDIDKKLPLLITSILVYFSRKKKFKDKIDIHFTTMYKKVLEICMCFAIETIKILPSKASKVKVS